VSTADAIRTEIDGPIGWLVVDRPEARGAMTRAMWEALPTRLNELASAEGVRLVVIRGSGGYFIAGADITEFQEYRSDPELARKYDEGSSGTLQALERLAVPSVAMIDGPCVGGGSLIAFGCDLRVASDRAFLAIPAGRLGLAYPHHGLERLVAVVGEARALDLILTGRRIGGAEALSLGLVQRCFPAEHLEAETRLLAGDIAKMAPKALLYARLATRRRLTGILSREEIDSLVADCFASDDYREGVAAFLEKRDPIFRGR
jgi:enoyl-CoA hydratase